MKKLFFTIVAAVYATSLFAQQASQWSLSSVKSDVKTLIPVLFGLGALVALVYWMVNNLMDNGEEDPLERSLCRDRHCDNYGSDLCRYECSVAIMESYINRRLRDRVMVAGMPAERFMACVGIACIPILIVIFNPLFVLFWIPWGVVVFWIFRNIDRLSRNLTYGKQFPSHLKNR